MTTILAALLDENVVVAVWHHLKMNHSEANRVARNPSLLQLAASLNTGKASYTQICLELLSLVAKPFDVEITRESGHANRR